MFSSAKIFKTLLIHCESLTELSPHQFYPNLARAIFFFTWSCSSILVSECAMELPDVVKEKLIELDDENNQLRAEVTRLRASIVNKDEILNELEEENVQLRAAKQKIGVDNAKCLQLEQTIVSLRVTLEEKTRDSYNLMHEVETLTASLVSAQSEIDELRRASTPPSTEESIIVEPSNKEEMELAADKKGLLAAFHLLENFD
ncbi:unnamed protein product [Cylicostephanus goldi]|uniref:Uncharacterized protein n=1 Tax=Cylicostephanus goldi TaxID=71465 RepID=A0A3P6SFP5_CYLGO|nr:unnamed protein product [Cylicostephanus goldi]